MKRGTVQHVPLLVLGAGTDGLAAALALAYQGFPVHLLDRGPDPLFTPQEFPAPGRVAPASGTDGVVLVPPRAAAELDALGLLDLVVPHAGEPARIVHLDGQSGKTLREIDLAPARQRWNHPLLVVPAERLRRVLGAACAADDMIVTEYDNRPSLVEDVLDAVLVGDEQGPRLRAEALVAADGPDSRVRGLLGGGQVASAPIATLSGPAPEATVPDDEIRLWSSPMLHAARVATPAGARAVVHVRVDLAPPDLRRALQHHLPELRETLEPLVAGAGTPVLGTHRWPLDRWTRHRMTVLGAAAQPVLPHGGRALAETLLDGAALGTAFDRCDGRILEALERYERTRATPRAWSATRAHEAASLFHAEGLTRRLRDRLWSGERVDALAEAVGEE